MAEAPTVVAGRDRREHDLAIALTTLEATVAAGGGGGGGAGTAAAAPTGVAATDSLVFSGAAANTTYQLAAGVYVVNPTTLNNAGGIFVGASGRRTTIQLAGQGGGANVAMFTLGAARIEFRDLILDGNGSTIGSGASWTGFITWSGSASHDCAFRGCTIQNTARSGLLVNNPVDAVNRTIVDQCWFTQIGGTATGTAGTGIWMMGNCNDWRITNNRWFGTIPGTGIDVRGSASPYSTSNGNLIQGNTFDFSAVVAVDAGLGGIAAISPWVGNVGTRIIGNYVFGPAAIPTGGSVWALTLTDARYSVVMGNVIEGNPANSQAMLYGIEVSESPYTTVVGNTIRNVSYGMTLTNNMDLPAHGAIIADNVFQNCYTNAIQTTDSPVGLKIHDNTFIDCGASFIFMNSSVTQGLARAPRYADIHDNTFWVKDQTRVEASGAMNGIYILGLSATDKSEIDIHDNYFGPYPDGPSFACLTGSTTTVINIPTGFTLIPNSRVGQNLLCVTGANAGVSRLVTANTGTTITVNAFGSTPVAGDTFILSGGSGNIGLNAVYVNLTTGVRIYNNRFDGRQPLSGAAQALRPLTILSNDFNIHHNRADNFTTDFLYENPAAAGRLEYNDHPSLGLSYGATTNNLYVSTVDGKLHFRNTAGVDTAIA